ncbi:uncharacterized protein LOC113336631 [Papaver somniferum]|uniref:uncharacterized protein LOC113336631 n=1 Tax=Papaver somniferum TaxID=3469 RepID=UPI000E704B66|nr:uncharacterized protein LOC113336631 [Papaver somniferum]
MTKSLQAKYYSDDDLFNLENKSSSTWSWRSISSELIFVLKNSCWCLGDGKKILIWKHRWIKELHAPPAPKPGSSTHLQYKYVHQLLSSDSTSWDIIILREIFDDNIVNLILSIPIHASQEDMLVWLLDKNGFFSIKSAYRKMFEEDRGSESVGKEWIKHFLRKAISNLLSTRDVLSLKVPGIADICPYCEQWIGSWFDELYVNKISVGEICKRAITSWCLWTDRCDKVFQNISVQPDKSIKKYKSYIEDHSLQWYKTVPSNNSCCRRITNWIPPPSDFVTINCDGSFLNSLEGIQLIIRNCAGSQQAAKCIQLKCIRSADEAECVGLWEAVKWEHSLKLEKVHFELDAKTVVDAAMKNSPID